MDQSLNDRDLCCLLQFTRLNRITKETERMILEQMEADKNKAKTKS